MKKLALALGLIGLASTSSPSPSQAQVYSWQCNVQTYCNVYGYCWQRQQCCAWVTDAWGNTVWQCVWR